MLTSFYAIAAKYKVPLEAAHAHIDDDRYDMIECGAAGQLTLGPSGLFTDQLRNCCIAFTLGVHLGSANVLVSYRHRVEWTS